MYDTEIAFLVVLINGVLVIRYWAAGLKLNLTSGNQLENLWTTQRLLAVLFTTPAMYCSLCELQQFFPEFACWLHVLKNFLCTWHMYIFFRILLLTSPYSLSEILTILDNKPHEKTSGWTNKGVLFRRAYKWATVFALAKPVLSLVTAISLEVRQVLPEEAFVVNSIITAGVSIPLVFYAISITKTLASPISKLPNVLMKAALVLVLMPLLGFEDDIVQVLSYSGFFGGDRANEEYAHWRGEDIFAQIVSIQMLILSLLYWRGIFWSVEDLKQVFEEPDMLLKQSEDEKSRADDWRDDSPVSIEAPVIGPPKSVDLDRMAEVLGLDMGPLDEISAGESNEEVDFLSLYPS